MPASSIISSLTNPSVVKVNNFTLDAFSRLRVSEPLALFDSKLLYDKMPLFWDESIVSGGSSTHSTATSSVTMTTGGVAQTGSVIRQTKQRFNYQPGRSQLVIMTGVLGAGATGIRRRVGLFDANNGLFFELDGTTLSVVQRSSTSGSPVDTVISRTNWNGDKLDGTGKSGFTLDTTKGNIFWLDFEWLGVGTVRFGVFSKGEPILCHSIYNENTKTTVYMATPNLPLRYEIYNNGTADAASLVHICSTVISEGSTSENGIVRSIDRGITGFTTGNNTSLYSTLAMRLKADHLGSTIRNISISMLCTSSADFRWALILNPTVAGTDAANWTALDNSSIEYDISRTTTNTLSGGTVLASGYISAATDHIDAGLASPLTLGSTIAGVRDEIVLAVQRLSGTTETFYGSISFREMA
jgi:hypothetical protein